LPTGPISSDDDTDSTESDSECDSEHDPDVDMRMEDDVDAPDGVDLDGHVYIEKNGDDEEEKDEEEEIKVVEDEKEEEEENEDEDDGKKPQTISQGEIVNTSADDIDTMVEHQPIVLPDQGLEMHKHTPRPQSLASDQPPQTPERSPQPSMPETDSPSRLENLRLVTLQKPRLVVPSLQEDQAAGITSDVDVDQQLLGKSAGGNCLPDVPLPEAHPDDFVGVEWTSPCIAEEAMVVAFWLELGCCLVCFLCSDQFISGIDYYTRREGLGSLRVYFIHSIMGHRAGSMFATTGV